MSSDVDVRNETPYAIDDDAVARVVRAVLALEEAEGEVAVAFLDETAMAELNGRYRGLAEATDVLSFPGGDEDGWPEPQGGMSDDEDGEEGGDADHARDPRRPPSWATSPSVPPWPITTQRPRATPWPPSWGDWSCTGCSTCWATTTRSTRAR